MNQSSYIITTNILVNGKILNVHDCSSVSRNLLLTVRCPSVACFNGNMIYLLEGIARNTNKRAFQLLGYTVCVLCVP